MDENRIKELYEAEINDSAPDFEKLWDKIDSSLSSKETSAPEISITPSKSHLNAVKAIAALAAGIAIVAFIPSLFSADQLTAESSEPSIMPSDDFADEAPSDSVYEQDDSAYEQNDSVYEQDDSVAMEESDSEMWEEEDYILSYEDLSFDSYSETVFTCNGTPYGGEYFVEDEILSEADYLISGVVKNVFRKEDGSSICYELEMNESYPGKISETIIVESCSAYTMKRGRKYLLPLAETDDGYRTVYDNIPQIEFTSDGGLVYYNGWTSLDNDSSQSIIYPKRTVDDFFYDRMKFSYSGDYSMLIEKFYDAKDL